MSAISVRGIFIFLLTMFTTASVWSAEAIPQDQSAAVILVYYQVGEDQNPLANIRKEQFAAHIQELESGAYTIKPLTDIIDSLEQGKRLPDRTVAITFDGAYRSVLTSAAPILLKKNIPFTIFVAPDNMEQTADLYLSTDEIRKLARNKLVTIGLHPLNYTRLVHATDEEIRRQVNGGHALLREKTGITATLFAYPFGEYSNNYRQIIAESGFKAAFGQQSGVAYNGSDLLALPRFSMTESFAGSERFNQTVGALPLPVTDVEPQNPRLDTKRPVIGFTVSDELKPSIKKISCFASGFEKPQLERIGSRIELRLDHDIDQDHTRINCTLPVKAGEFEEDTRYRWFGMLLTPPEVKNTLGERVE